MYSCNKLYVRIIILFTVKLHETNKLLSFLEFYSLGESDILIKHNEKGGVNKSALVSSDYTNVLSRYVTRISRAFGREEMNKVPT